ncbi:MAG TPA: DUF167 domain-containing protein [Paucimonas sp.]|nr:DUF167 domain-containing protein [Paucimonas sp.]
MVGLHDDALKIRPQAQPIDGKANEALIRYLADRPGVLKSAVTNVHGQAGRRKILEVRGALTTEMAEEILRPSDSRESGARPLS